MAHGAPQTHLSDGHLGFDLAFLLCLMSGSFPFLPTPASWHLLPGTHDPVVGKPIIGPVWKASPRCTCCPFTSRGHGTKGADPGDPMCLSGPSGCSQAGARLAHSDNVCLSLFYSLMHHKKRSIVKHIVSRATVSSVPCEWAEQCGCRGLLGLGPWLVSPRLSTGKQFT